MSTFAVNELAIKVYGGTITKELAVSIGDLETVEIPLVALYTSAWIEIHLQKT